MHEGTRPTSTHCRNGHRYDESGFRYVNRADRSSRRALVCKACRKEGDQRRLGVITIIVSGDSTSRGPKDPELIFGMIELYGMDAVRRWVGRTRVEVSCPSA